MRWLPGALSEVSRHLFLSAQEKGNMGKTESLLVVAEVPVPSLSHCGSVAVQSVEAG